jgi:hypothetical protein
LTTTSFPANFIAILKKMYNLSTGITGSNSA